MERIGNLSSQESWLCHVAVIIAHSRGDMARFQNWDCMAAAGDWFASAALLRPAGATPPLVQGAARSSARSTHRLALALAVTRN
jgi:hypothetical protein